MVLSHFLVVTIVYVDAVDNFSFGCLRCCDCLDAERGVRSWNYFRNSAFLIFPVDSQFIVISVSVYSYKRILVLISHSQDFLNGVCTNIVHMSKRRLKYYTGNYEAFVRTRMELLENQMKQYNWEQDQIAHMKVTITVHTGESQL